MHTDPWLERWLQKLKASSGGGVLLELGSGGGVDTRTLVDAGHAVIALELSPRLVAEAQARVPGAAFHCRDLRAPFPLAGRLAGGVVASLSLHYFPWHETLGIVQRIQACLAPGGLLLCRLNSVRDHHFGASGHPALAENYYLVDGTPKRFFDRQHVVDLFRNGWTFLSLEEHEIHRYDAPKVVWEAVLERAAEEK